MIHLTPHFIGKENARKRVEAQMVQKEGDNGPFHFVGEYWEARQQGKWDECPNIFGEFNEDLVDPLKLSVMILVQVSFASFIKNHLVTKPIIIILFMLLPSSTTTQKVFIQRKRSVIQ